MDVLAYIHHSRVYCQEVLGPALNMAHLHPAKPWGAALKRMDNLLPAWGLHTNKVLVRMQISMRGVTNQKAIGLGKMDNK